MPGKLKFIFGKFGAQLINKLHAGIIHGPLSNPAQIISNIGFMSLTTALTAHR